MLMPRKVKYRKQFRGKNRGSASRGNKVSFGTFGLQVLENGFIDARQIEAGRRAISRSTKRGGKTWIRIFPNKPFTKRAAEAPMGGGKGAVEYWAAVVKRGAVVFEVDGVSEAVAREAFRLVSSKLPVKTRFVMHHNL